MRKINKMDVLRLVLVLALVAGIGLAFGAVGRFVPTHKIVQPVYCGSCHPEQVQELGATTHLAKFTAEVEDFTANSRVGLSQGGTNNGVATESAYTNARSISGGCVMCHNFWENFKWYGVKNIDIVQYDGDIPSIGVLSPATDIYGNAVSPYGLGSTAQYVMKIGEVKGVDSTGALAGTGLTAEPWKAGLNNYQYTDASGTHSRLDYVWSRLSALSPGPVGFAKVAASNGALSSCGGGTVEHGMCHIAASAVALAYTDQKLEVSDYPDTMNDTVNSTTGTVSGNMAGKAGKGIFFTHEMAFTTAQYSAKQVKICGACHVMKLPPMRWGGEPWSIIDIKEVSALGADITVDDMNAALEANTDPFGFRPSYGALTATNTIQDGISDDGGMVIEELTKEARGSPNPVTVKAPVAFRTPDWAHSNVPCIRCHAHAGINGETVSANSGTIES